MAKDYPGDLTRSAALFERAKNVYAGGTTRGQVVFRPHLIYARSGKGCLVRDVDDVERVDFINNYTDQVHGHSHPRIIDAIRRQIGLQISCWLPTESELELAERICARAHSFEKIRFCNSGTEAVMHAIKAARAYTGRPKIAKCEGAYHGTYDYVDVSLDSDPQNWGPEEAPRSVPRAYGAPQAVLNDIAVIPFNDAQRAEGILETHKDDLACIIVDLAPSRFGGPPVSPEYLEVLRNFTHRTGALLIVDEIITFRLHSGGAQTIFGCDPDLTTLSKVVGGGFPVGAIAGKADVMGVFAESNSKSLVSQSGTFTANPVAMVAGAASLDLLPQEEIERLNALGDRARGTINEAFQIAEVDGSVTGEGSLLFIHPSSEPLTDYRSHWLAHAEGRANQLEALFRRLLNHGVVISPIGWACLSTPMNDSHVDHLGDAILACLKEMKDAKELETTP